MCLREEFIWKFSLGIALLAMIFFVHIAFGTELHANKVNKSEPIDNKVISRKIAVLYDPKQIKSVTESDLVYLGAPLSYLGFVSIDYPINKLPSLKGRYAGIIVWVDPGYLVPHANLQKALINKSRSGVPILFLSSIGPHLTKDFYRYFGLKAEQRESVPKKAKILSHDSMIGYEVQPHINPHDFVYLQNNSEKNLVSVTDGSGYVSDMAALKSWGGYVLDPFIYFEVNHGQVRWVVNPLKLFKKVFVKSNYPIPDVTTENGRRLLMVHVDGDGFISAVESEPKLFAGDVMLRDIFQHYKIPTTVSVIQADLDPKGWYPKTSERAENIAREIFKLPWVEIASHSFSHPLVWQKTKVGDGAESLVEEYYRPIADYKFSLEQEIAESVKYINRHLAPKGKTCRVFLWTGYCNPDDRAVEIAYHNNLLNMNGGDTTITKRNKSLTNIAPLGIYKGKYFQVFAPMQNENIYTNLWEGPFYGYQRVIETFKLTNKPLRFKPIDVYYHFYSASKQASLKALKKVYDWCLHQPVMNVFVSEYISKVLDFNGLAIAKYRDGWEIKTSGDLREFRIAKSWGYPDLKRSKNVIGFSPYGKDYYVHLGPDKTSFLYLSNNKPKLPYIYNANGRITFFARTENGVGFRVSSYTPTKFVLVNVQKCRLSDRGQKTKPVKVVGNLTYFDFSRVLNRSVDVLCD